MVITRHFSSKNANISLVLASLECMFAGLPRLLVHLTLWGFERLVRNKQFEGVALSIFLHVSHLLDNTIHLLIEKVLTD